MLIYLVFGVTLAFEHHIHQGWDWCHYWNARGIPKEECMGLQAKEQPQSSTIPPPPPEYLPVCLRKFFFSICRPDFRCSSGLRCIDVDNTSCCHPTKEMCPTTEQMGYQCMVKNPINWCNQDSDCGMQAKCCPTGCNYNVCI